MLFGLSWRSLQGTQRLFASCGTTTNDLEIRSRTKKKTGLFQTMAPGKTTSTDESTATRSCKAAAATAHGTRGAAGGAAEVRRNFVSSPPRDTYVSHRLQRRSMGRSGFSSGDIHRFRHQVNLHARSSLDREPEPPRGQACGQKSNKIKPKTGVARIFLGTRLFCFCFARAAWIRSVHTAPEPPSERAPP